MKLPTIGSILICVSWFAATGAHASEKEVRDTIGL